MLELRALEAGYGETQIVHGFDLVLAEGRIHAILGRNGVGKTTTLKTIVGLLGALGGEVCFRGHPITGHRPFDIARAGIAYVPETRDIFGSLSVLENLRLAARGSREVASRAGRSSACSSSIRTSPPAAATAAISSPVASSRCSRSRARWS